MNLINRPAAFIAALAIGAAALVPLPVFASSHMDAPLITLDDAANTTDVYSFVAVSNGTKYLVTALSVFPFEEPGIGPNAHRFDDNVLYSIHVATGDNVAAGRATYSYDFQFETTFKNQNTILQAYTGVVNGVDDATQNLVQRYTVTRTDLTQKGKASKPQSIGSGIVPPNNQGLVTPKYNQGNSGENPAKEGVADAMQLDDYTKASISNFGGTLVFAGQRDDGFYADIQSIFDLDFSFAGPNKPFDSQGGFNVHTIVVAIPVDQIGGDQQVVGVYASTSRPQVTVLASPRSNGNTKGEPDRSAPKAKGKFIQVARQGNPLFNEALVPIKDKDFYSRSNPSNDQAAFSQYALNPELAVVLGVQEDRRTNRTDLAGIFIPDLIKTDLSTGPARLAGGDGAGAAPDDAGFHRLGIFGGDVLTSTVQEGFGSGTIPGGWPNGRRFGDDVIDIAVIAILSDLRTSPPMIIPNASNADVDRVSSNDIGYNKVFPYAATPLNGRNHPHHGDRNSTAAQ
jgi:hypothetical protein